MTLAYWALAALDDDGRGDASFRVGSDDAQYAAMDHDRDANLVDRIRSGDPMAFEALYRATWAGLVGFATSLIHDPDIAEEIVGDVFAGVWRRREVWRPVTAQSYLFGAVRNRAFNYRRTEARASAALRRAAPGDLAEPAAVYPDAGIVASERYQAVRVALAELTEPQRTLLALRWQRQMAWDEIAHVLGVSSTAVQQQHSRILKRLRVAVDAVLG